LTSRAWAGSQVGLCAVDIVAKVDEQCAKLNWRKVREKQVKPLTATDGRSAQAFVFKHRNSVQQIF